MYILPVVPFSNQRIWHIVLYSQSDRTQSNVWRNSLPIHHPFCIAFLTLFLVHDWGLGTGNW